MVDIYTLFKETLTAAAALGAVFVANEGLKTWRRQLTGSNEYELSRRILRGIYAWRDAVSRVRNPIIWAAELREVSKGAPIHDSEARFHGIAKVYEQRWLEVANARTTLESELLESEVLWGPSVKTQCVTLWRLQAELLVYLEQWLECQDPRTSSHTRSAIQEVLQSGRRVLYERAEGDGGFTNELIHAIATIETLLKPHLRRDA